MRKLVASGLVGALLILALLATVVMAGCGDAVSAQAGLTTGEDILNQALTSATPISNGTGQFNVSVAVNGDSSKMPAEAKAFLGQPITLSGTVSASDKPLAAEMTMTASFAGQQIPIGLKMVDNKAWVSFMGQWYEAPAEVNTALAGAQSKPQTDPQAMLQAIKAAGVDPVTWITGLKVVGEEDLNGTTTYHLSGSLDINKIISDGLKISQDKNIQGLIPSLGALGGTNTSTSMPTDQELQSMQTQLTQMFQNLTLDLWIAKDGYQLRKAELNAKVVPPAGEDAQGINDITLKADFSMTPATAPVTVTPPTDAKPFSDLEQSLGMLQGLFSGALGGALGSGQ